MKFIDVLEILPSYESLIQVGYEGKKTGIMKAGKIKYMQINRLNYRKDVLSIVPFQTKSGKCAIFVTLVEEKFGC